MDARVISVDERFVWVARDKGSEWRAIQSFLLLGQLPFRLLVEAVCEPFIPNRQGKVLTPSEAIRNLSANLFPVVASGPVWVDLGNLTTNQLFTSADIARMLSDLRAKADGWAHRIIPVVRTTSEAPVVVTAIQWASSTGSGICIRIMGTDGLENKSALVDALVRWYGLRHCDVDLVVDAQDLPSVMTQRAIADAFPICNTCRSWTIVAGTFPNTITHLSRERYVHILPRTEWTAFSGDVSLRSGERTPLYGDYATQGSIYTPSQPYGASHTLRYTAGEEFLVLRGGGGKDSDSTEYIGHARFIRGHPLYRDVTAGQAEAYIERIAVGTNGTGNAMTWRVASLQRHISVTAAQWAAHIAIRPLVHSSV